jgi:hypothetical protein
MSRQAADFEFRGSSAGRAFKTDMKSLNRGSQSSERLLGVATLRHQSMVLAVSAPGVRSVSLRSPALYRYVRGIARVLSLSDQNGSRRRRTLSPHARHNSQPMARDKAHSICVRWRTFSPWSRCQRHDHPECSQRPDSWSRIRPRLDDRWSSVAVQSRGRSTRSVKASAVSSGGWSPAAPAISNTRRLATPPISHRACRRWRRPLDHLSETTHRWTKATSSSSRWAHRGSKGSRNGECLGLVESDDPLAQMDAQVRRRRGLESLKRRLCARVVEPANDACLRGPSLDRHRNASAAQPVRGFYSDLARADASELPPRVHASVGQQDQLCPALSRSAWGRECGADARRRRRSEGAQASRDRSEPRAIALHRGDCSSHVR